MADTATVPNAGGSGEPQAPSPATPPASGQSKPSASPTKAFDRAQDPNSIQDLTQTRILRGKSKDPKINPLPGVIDAIERGEPDPDELDEDIDVRQAEGRQRDPQTGRFVKTGEAEGEPQADPKTTTAEQPPDPKTQTPQTQGKLTFLGKEYGSIGEIEHQHKTLQGNFNKLKETASQNYQAALAWKAEAERLQHGEASPRTAPGTTSPTEGQGRTPSGPTPSGDSEAKGFADTFDWKTYYELKRASPAAAEIFMAEEMAEYNYQRLDQRLKPIEAPAQQQKADDMYREEVKGVFTQLADSQDQQGNPYYPELSDPEATKIILNIWANSGLDRALAKQPYAVHGAVMTYRAWKLSQPQSTAPQDPRAQAVAAATAQELRGNRTHGIVEPPSSPDLRPSGPMNQNEDVRRGIRTALPYGDGRKGLLGVLP